MKREERLNFIANLIKENEIKTQEELVSRLLAHQIDVTQATISRDIKSLALIKVPAETGGYRYDLPKNNEALQSSLHKALAFDAITKVKIHESMIALCTNPGTTSLVKKYLLQECDSEIFSITTDDDSVLVIFETNDEAKKVYESLIV
ncbi:arginine repressor [Lactococcus allomyrinae]|uniref:Arginine repressor n=1 Tax=Lactococcus allomyrinae TaxID=2419773 RepID=A0A387BA04_9LACT|nr:arginine repressor [Lactococcus allomyrinae]AYG00563.1 transcriptional regulator [Lactococcus allomyrinae]